MDEYIIISVRVTDEQLDSFENVLTILEDGGTIVAWWEEECELG